MKNILTLITFLASVNLAIAQECDLPPAGPPTNTGSNMTLFLTPGFMIALDIQNEPAYIIVFDGDLIVGYEDLIGVSQTSLSIWGDDSLTPELDGAEENGGDDGEPLSFQLVDGSSLYDIEMSTPVTYTTGGLVPLQGFLALTDACIAVLEGCMDSSANNYNADATVDDASCTYDVLGCMDSSANNYNADATVDDGSCEFTSSSGEPIEYAIADGWNMVGYVGTDSPANNVVNQINAALVNGSDIETTFDVIKNANGQFWSLQYDGLGTFNPGQGYMMKVKLGQATSLNFQQ